MRFDTHVAFRFRTLFDLAAPCVSMPVLLICDGPAGANDEEAVSDSAVPARVPPRSRKAH